MYAFVGKTDHAWEIWQIGVRYWPPAAASLNEQGKREFACLVKGSRVLGDARASGQSASLEPITNNKHTPHITCGKLV